MQAVKNDIKNNVYNWVIYKIISPSQRVYIGKSSRFKDRLRHYEALRCKDQPCLYNSFVKYGFKNHTIEIIDEFSSNTEYADGKEMFWIRSYMSQLHKYPEQNGLNLTMGGEGIRGYKHTPEQNKRNSERKKAACIGEERERFIQTHYTKRGLPHPRLGMKHSQESKQKMSVSKKGISVNKGKVRTPEMKEKYRQSSMGKSLGRKYTGETLERIRIGGLSKQKPVLRYDLNNVFISEHSGMSQASRDTGIPISTIGHILNSRIPHPKTFIFKYKQ